MRIIEDTHELDEELEKIQGQIQDFGKDTEEFAALLSDRDEIIAAALESRTYLEAEGEELAKQFLTELIQKVYCYDENQAEMFYSIPVPGTEKTAEGYKGSAVNSHEGILLEKYRPLVSSLCPALSQCQGNGEALDRPCDLRAYRSLTAVP